MPERKVVALVFHGHMLVGGGSVQMEPGGGKRGEGKAAAFGGGCPQHEVRLCIPGKQAGRQAGGQISNCTAAHMAWEPMAWMMWEAPLLKRVSALVRPMWAAAAAAPGPGLLAALPSMLYREVWGPYRRRFQPAPGCIAGPGGRPHATEC